SRQARRFTTERPAGVGSSSQASPRPANASGRPGSQPQQSAQTRGPLMSNPVPVQVVSDARPAEVIIISHSPLFYWWPVWAVGFFMAGLSYWQDQRMAFVPPGTVAERGARVEGVDGPRDALITPAGQSLPAASDSDELQQPRMRMAQSNNPGIIWA